MSFMSAIARLFGRRQRITTVPARISPKTSSRLKKSGTLMAAAVALVGTWEGIRTVAYLDTIASPPVWTVCAGETRGVKKGDRYTRAECNDMLAEGLVQFEKKMRSCLSAPDALPDGVYTVFLSLSWNIGTGGFCRSTVVKRANAGDLKGACDAIRMWNRAGGRVVKGLDNRRRDEQRICLGAL
ncbi:lysozyme [Fulvimarina manganoxydans]|uniref:Lysozyme n=1 Tax=Fulvimarina manganoxydans TaxID=937218 RepID=A0A1W2A982_9HYPH|nr:lysozyme [Fulvimarina manganoxydans]SMC57022.1 lysozyme [Fulvimarina manganoxydans]